MSKAEKKGRKVYEIMPYLRRKQRSQYFGKIGSKNDPHHGKGPYQGKVVNGKYVDDMPKIYENNIKEDYVIGEKRKVAKKIKKRYDN